MRSKGNSDPSSCLDKDRGDVGGGESGRCAEDGSLSAPTAKFETGLDFQKQGAAPATSLSPVPGHRRGSARFSAALWQGFALLSMGRNWFPPARWWASPRLPCPPRGTGHGGYLSARCRQRCPPGTASGSPNPLANLPFQGTSLGVPSRSLHNPASNPL